MIDDTLPLTTRKTTLAEHQRNKGQAQALDLVIDVCNALAVEEIDYCHWKSNAALDRSASGDNDLDLLVSRRDAQLFAEILYRLGFKEAYSPKEHELPGVQDYYGYDLRSGRLVHVHAHFQLVLGNDLSKNYRLPLEAVYLKSSVQQGLFRVPTLEWELVIFVIRMVLKHSSWDSMLMGHGQLSPSERRELEYLSQLDVMVKAQAILRHVPGLSARLLGECIDILQPGSSIWKRIRVAGKLEKILQPNARRPHVSDVIVKFTRRLWWPIEQRFSGYQPRNRFSNGGLFIAIVGGDGAGKTTIMDELASWLSGKFAVTNMHMGKPRWSWATIVIRGILKIGTLLRLYPFEGDTFEELQQPHGLPWFIRSVCTARDRYLTYARARRLSSNGKLVLCDRFSFPGFMAMDGPECQRAIASLGNASWFHHLLTSLETSFYEKIKLPDLVIVLKVQPEIAVQRKTNESEASVRARSTEVWDLDWSEKSAFVIDANLSREQVLSQVRACVWAHL